MALIRIYDIQKVGPGHQLQCRQIRLWMAFYVLQGGEKVADFISNYFSVDPPTRHTHTNTHTHITHTHTYGHTHTQSDDNNRRKYNRLHFF